MSALDREELGARLERIAGLDGPVSLHTGYLASVDRVSLVAEYVESVEPTSYVLDPEWFARSGQPRVDEEQVDLVVARLLPRAHTLVCNAREAERITGRGVNGPAEMRDACRALMDRGLTSVLVTGGHLDGFPRDIFHDGNGFEELGGDRIPVDGHLSGAGGILSAAVAAGIAIGAEPFEAVVAARQHAVQAIRERVFVATRSVIEREPGPDRDSRGMWVAVPPSTAGAR